MTEHITNKDWIYGLAEHNNALFAAKASGLYASTDWATTWEPALQESLTEGSAITAILSHQDAFFAASVGGIFQSANIKDWQAIPFRAPSPTLSALIADPSAEGKTLYAASLEDGVFHSSNSGQTWEAWNIGLFDLHVLSLVQRGSDLYAGTETGLYISNNQAKTWDYIELPVTDAVLSLASHQGNLYVGTEEQGLYSLKHDSWEKLELPEGAINQILCTDTLMFILIDDKIYSSNQANTFGYKEKLNNVSCLAIVNNRLALGFGDGTVKLEKPS